VRRRLEALEVDEHEKEGDERVTDVGEDEELEQQRRAKVTLRRADQREGGDERKNERRAKLQPVEGLIRRHDFDTTSEDHGTHDLDSQVGHRKKSEDKVGGGD